MTTRDEHLAWCKQRALAYVERGDLSGAIASMSSDLTKWDEPIYDSALIVQLMKEGIECCNSPDEMRQWINDYT